MSRIIAIDFGMKRIGLATTDPLQIIATPLTTVLNKDCLDFLSNYCSKEQVELFVVGQPFRANGEPSDVEKDILKFIEELRKLFPRIPVARQDEQFTSQKAKMSLIESGVKKMKRREKGLLDSTAATLILQDYLAERI